MSWFKKLFGGKCKCHEEKKEEPAVAPTVEPTVPETPAAPEENTQV
jgi:hypothetical protein